MVFSSVLSSLAIIWGKFRDTPPWICLVIFGVIAVYLIGFAIMSEVSKKGRIRGGVIAELEHGTLRKICSQSEIDKASCTAGIVLANAPTYSYIFGDLGFMLRCEALTWLFTKNIRLLCDTLPGSCIGLFESPGARPSCFFTLHPPRGTISIYLWWSYGLFSVPFVLGIGATRRWLQARGGCGSALYETVFAPLFGSQNYFILENLAVTPARQGMGVELSCVAAALEQVVRPAGAACVVCVQQQEEVPLFQAAGFKVVKEVGAWVQGEGSQWLMAWEPEASSGEEGGDEKSGGEKSATQKKND